ncbi:MAG TPA: hypothetical protein VK742_12445 [Candidatus Sulfotelmatobacter sp.]|jgi:hypothetical protein|nr:hypothetical protein [Candidatus Sulfotelmatobacter sp.]
MPNSTNVALALTRRGAEILILGIVFALLTGGCASQHSGRARRGAEVWLPKVAAVTATPLAPILTTGNAFESVFTLTLGDNPDVSAQVSGQLMVRGGKLRLEVTKAIGKTLRAGDFGVVWDTVAHQGFVFSEALQGYAPINEPFFCTNLVTRAIAGEAGQIDGHPVQQANVTVMQSDGQTMTVQLARAGDFGDLPLKIGRLTGGDYSFTLALAKIEMVAPAEELFLPPDGFTKYENATTMLSELTERQQNVSGAGHGSNDGQSAGPPPTPQMPH